MKDVIGIDTNIMFSKNIIGKYEQHRALTMEIDIFLFINARIAGSMSATFTETKIAIIIAF